MKGLFDELYRLGLSVSEFERFSGVSFNTLKKVSDGIPVRAATLGRIRFALRAAKEQLSVELSRPVHSKEQKKVVR